MLFAVGLNLRAICENGSANDRIWGGARRRSSLRLAPYRSSVGSALGDLEGSGSLLGSQPLTCRITSMVSARHSTTGFGIAELATSWTVLALRLSPWN